VKPPSAFLTILRNYSTAPDIPYTTENKQLTVEKKRCCMQVGGVPEVIVPTTIDTNDNTAQPIYHHFTITAPIVSNDSVISVLRKIVEHGRSISIRISIKLIEGITTTWDVMLDGKTMLVTVPSGILAEGSKQSLVCLLELGSLIDCNCCIVAFKKDCRDVRQLMRTFMFLGFQPIPSPPAYWKAKGHICMAYEID